MGLGALKLQVPRSLGVRLKRPGSFLASFDTEGLEKRGKVYQSANWENAERKVEIEITAVLAAAWPWSGFPEGCPAFARPGNSSRTAPLCPRGLIHGHPELLL